MLVKAIKPASSVFGFIIALKNELVAPLKRWTLLNFYLDTSFYDAQPDRIWINNRLWPKLAKMEQGRILFVGCTHYTWKSLHSFNKGVDLITVDYEKRNSLWGGKKHLVADIQEIDRLVEPGSCDIILLNGIFGHGVNTAEAQTKTYRAIYNIMQPDGLLLIGWNHDLSLDPLELPAREELFEKTTFEDLPERTCFLNCTHVYDFLKPKKRKAA